MDTVSVTVMTFDEFDELVKRHFPERSDYEFVADEEAYNGCSYYIENAGEMPTYKPDTPESLIAEFAQNEKDRFDKWLRNEPYSRLGRHKITDELVYRGHLPQGNYLITVYW